MTLAIVPFPVDLPTSLALAEEALRCRLAPGEQLSELLPQVAAGIRTGRAGGGLLRTEGVARGVVVWDPAGPVGVAVRLLYVAPPYSDVDGYTEALEVTERAAGPIAFAPGPLAGLPEEVETSLMRGRGFAPFGRSEMVLPPAAPVDSAPLPSGVGLRPVRDSDQGALARLHERAYEDHLDRYLAIEDLDPARDADRQLRDYFAGRYGQLLSPGSSVATRDGRAVAAAIASRHSNRALLIDVMADPEWQGAGLGRAVLSDAVRALRVRGESPIVLNVTEGNDRATRLYSHLGFVRTLGPTREWYDARRLRVRFPDRPSR